MCISFSWPEDEIEEQKRQRSEMLDFDAEMERRQRFHATNADLFPEITKREPVLV